MSGEKRNPVARRGTYTLHGQAETEPGVHVYVWCPACDSVHQFRVKLAQGEATGPTWGWDGSLDAPTFNPSYLTWAGDRNKPTSRCHSFLRAGQWQFLTDSTHHLAGQTVPMVPLPDWLADE